MTNLLALVAKEKEPLVQFAERCQFFLPTSLERCWRRTRPAFVVKTLDHHLLRISSRDNILWLPLKSETRWWVSVVPHVCEGPSISICVSTLTDSTVVYYLCYAISFFYYFFFHYICASFISATTCIHVANWCQILMMTSTKQIVATHMRDVRWASSQCWCGSQ